VEGNVGARIKAPLTYHRQYVGIIVGGRKLIYINAFRASSEPKRKVNFEGGWVDWCDGGTGNWGALYDTQSGNFSELRTNGGMS
jgi:hypothetical protein